jgi:hypothetical protein
VSSIEESRDHVVLRLDQRQELRVRRTILALPVTRLADIAFEPAVDRANQRLSAELAIGPAAKIAALLPEIDSQPRVVVGGEVLTTCWRYDSLITGFARTAA